METEQEYNDDFNYRMAKNKVKEIKGFYIHLMVYLFVNAAILILSTREEGLWEGIQDLSNYTTALIWGIGILAHGVGVFGPNLFFGKDWEERKTREFMEKEKKNSWE